MKNIDLEQATETAVRLAKEAGILSKEHFGKVEVDWKNLDISNMKGAKKYLTQSVTPIDYASQRMILQGLIDVGFNKTTGVFAEEDVEELSSFVDNKDLRWVIDPIDGTFIYATANDDTKRNLEEKFDIKIDVDHRNYGVSIGLQENQKDFLLGVIYLPILDELYVAVRGKGATKNGDKLLLPQVNFSENSRIHLNSKSDFVKEIIPAWQQPLCTVYSLTGITIGKNEAFFARSTHLHDVGPSTLIIQESGGYVSDEKCQPIDFRNIYEKGRIPYYLAGPNKEFNSRLLQKIRDSGFDFE